MGKGKYKKKVTKFYTYNKEREMSVVSKTLENLIQNQQWEQTPFAPRNLPKKWIGTIYEEDGAITDMDLGVK